MEVRGSKNRFEFKKNIDCRKADASDIFVFINAGLDDYVAFTGDPFTPMKPKT